MPLPQVLVGRGEAPPRCGSVSPGGILATVVSAGWRAVAAALSGLLLVGGIALVLWAVTPGSGADAGGILHGGVVAFAAAHFLPVRIGGVPVTIHPLLLTVIALAVIASASGRARMVRGRMLEALHASVFSLAYAIAVDLVVVLAAPAGSAESGLLAPLCLAVVGSLLGLAGHRTAWNRWWRRTMPPWVRAAVRASAMAVCVLLAAGAAAVAIGLASSLGDAAAVSRLAVGPAAPIGADLGLLLLGLAFLPNAVVAGVGYVSGAGFSIGAGSYSPLAVHTADLPAIPLLAAAPDSGSSSLSLLAFAAPLAAGLLIAVLVCRALDTRRERLMASGVAAALSGLAVACLAGAAGGGVAGGAWSSSGASPALAGALVAGLLLVFAGTWSGLAGLRAVAWTVDRDSADRDGSDLAGDGSDPRTADGRGAAAAATAAKSADGDADAGAGGDGDADADGAGFDVGDLYGKDSDGEDLYGKDSDGGDSDGEDPDGEDPDGEDFGRPDVSDATAGAMDADAGTAGAGDTDGDADGDRDAGAACGAGPSAVDDIGADGSVADPPARDDQFPDGLRGAASDTERGTVSDTDPGADPGADAGDRLADAG